MGSETRDRMISSMQRMLQEKGYAATGLIGLGADSRAPKGSFYHHFPGGKEELAAAAIRASGAEAAAATARALSNSRTAAGGVRAMLEWLADQLERSGYRYGCPIATTTLEIASESDLIQRACADAYATWQAAIADRLIADGISKPAASSSAALVLASLEGALILCRARRDLYALRLLSKNVSSLLPRRDESRGPQRRRARS